MEASPDPGNTNWLFEVLEDFYFNREEKGYDPTTLRTIIFESTLHDLSAANPAIREFSAGFDVYASLWEPVLKRLLETLEKNAKMAKKENCVENLENGEDCLEYMARNSSFFL